MSDTDRRIIAALSPFVEARRVARMATVLGQRTKRVQVVFENLHDPHNGAAGLRSVEALGVQIVHVIESYSPFEVNADISMGCEKWVTLRRYPTTLRCVEELRRAGMRIIAADLTPGARPIEAIDWQGPVAIVFGNEHRGVSSPMRRAVDASFFLPICGFTQSFNLSVSCAMTLHYLRSQDRFRGDLGEDEREALLAAWLYRDVKGAHEVLRRAGLEAPAIDE